MTTKEKLVYIIIYPNRTIQLTAIAPTEIEEGTRVFASHTEFEIWDLLTWIALDCPPQENPKPYKVNE